MNYNKETLYLISFFLSITMGLGSRIYYANKLKGRSKQSGIHISREKALYFLVIGAFSSPIFYFLTDWFGFANYQSSDWIRIIGLLFTIGGNTMMIWTHKILGKNWSPILEIFTEHRIVTEGPYRYIRHPMYLGLFMIGFGIVLFIPNWLIGGFAIASITILYTIRVSDEEKMMLENFGSDYQNYMNQTGRLLPKL